jgi:hypothetical protein
MNLRKEFGKVNELTGTLNFSSGIYTRASDRGIVDNLEEIFIWEFD